MDTVGFISLVSQHEPPYCMSYRGQYNRNKIYETPNLTYRRDSLNITIKTIYRSWGRLLRQVDSFHFATWIILQQPYTLYFVDYSRREVALKNINLELKSVGETGISILI